MNSNDGWLSILVCGPQTISQAGAHQPYRNAKSPATPHQPSNPPSTREPLSGPSSTLSTNSDYYFYWVQLLSTTTTPTGPLSTLSSPCFSIIHSNSPSSQSNMGWSDGDDDRVTFCSFEMWIQFGREGLGDAEYEDFDDGDADNAGAHGLKWIQDWYGVFFVVTVGQFFSDNLRLCAFIHHGKVSPFGYHCHSLLRLFHHHDHFIRSIFIIIWSYGFQPSV